MFADKLLKVAVGTQLPQDSGFPIASAIVRVGGIRAHLTILELRITLLQVEHGCLGGKRGHLLRKEVRITITLQQRSYVLTRIAANCRGRID